MPTSPEVAAAIADLITATTALLDAVNVKKSDLFDARDAAAQSAEDAAGFRDAAQGIADDLAPAIAAAAAATTAALNAAAAALAAIATPHPRGNWVTATAYALCDTVVSGGVVYICVVAHTSAAAFGTDLAAVRWAVFQGLTAADLTALLADLLDVTTAAKGASKVGYKRSVTYGTADTVGLELSRHRGQGVQYVMAGDSIANGGTPPNATTVPGLVKAYYEPLSLATLTNDGIPGARLDRTLFGAGADASDLIPRYAAHVYPLRPAVTGAQRAILHLIIGANDYQLITRAQVATWCTAFSSYCAQAQTDGFEVVAHTITGRTTGINATIQAEENRFAINDFIRRCRYLNGYVDGAALLPNPADTTFFLGDGSHPNDDGNKRLALGAISEIARLGLRTPGPTMPAATGAPTVSAAIVAELERACLLTITSSTNPLLTAIPAIGTSDYSIEFWVNKATASAPNSPILDGGTGGSTEVGILYDSTIGFCKIYVNPGSIATWSPNCLYLDVWNHVAIVRVGTTVTYYANGVAVGTAADTNTHTTLTRYLQAGGGMKVARPRVRTRAMSAAEVLASFNSVSVYDDTETAYTFALSDGSQNRGSYVDDLSATKAHVAISDTTKTKIKSPGTRGRIQKTTTGSQSMVGVPIGARIVSWTVNVTVSGGGTVEIGDVSGNGRFYNSAIGVSKVDLVLLNRFPLNTGNITVNAAGYTIEHTVVWERF